MDEEGALDIATDGQVGPTGRPLPAFPTPAPLSSHGPARVIVVAGKPFGEPVARYGPFVMNTREELVQAVDDLRNGRF